MAIRMGDWKLVRHIGSTEIELYNLAKDIGEKKQPGAKRAGEVQGAESRLG